jgi:hypothetical protein
MNNIRCEECNKHLIPLTKWDDWSLLAHYFDMMFNEDYITQATYDRMMNALMSFKGFALQEDVKHE